MVSSIRSATVPAIAIEQPPSKGSPSQGAQTTANAWLLLSMRQALDLSGDGLLSFEEFRQNKTSVNLSIEDQAKLAQIDKAAFEALEQTDGATDSHVDLRVLAANQYLVNQVAQYGNPKASEYLLAAATAGGLVADPSAPTEAEKATLSALQDKLAQGGFGSLSSEDQAVVVRAGALMDAVEGGATPDPAQSLEALTKHLRYELGYEQTQPNVDAANFDCQSLLAGGTDADRLNLFLYNSVANQYKADLGLASQTDQSVPGFSFMLESDAPTNVPVTQGGSTESWRPSYQVLTPEQTQAVNDWVAVNGPVTDQYKAEVCAALAQKFSQSGWHFTAKSFPDVWVGQKQNIGVLQQAQDQAYREWNPDGTPKISSPEHVAAQLGQQLHLNYGPDGQPELDFQSARLGATDREAQAAPATVHDRGEWVWNDPANPPTKTIHHEGAQSAMGPTSDGWDEEVTDDTKVGDLSCGHWNYTPHEGAAAIPNTSDWVTGLTSQAETILQAVTVGRDELSTGASVALGIFTWGMGNLIHTGTHAPEYTPTQQFVIDQLKAQGRSSQNIEDAMTAAREDWVSALWSDGAFALVGVASATIGGGAIASAAARATAGMAARGGAQGLLASAARGGGVLIQNALDPLNLLGLSQWAAHGGLAQVLQATSNALGKLFGPASEVFNSLQALFQRAGQSGSPRELLALVKTAEQKMDALGPLSAEQQAVRDQLTQTEVKLSRATETQTALVPAATPQPRSSAQLAEQDLAGVTWNNASQTQGEVTLNEKIFDVIKTRKGQVFTGKFEQGESRFKALDASTGRPTGALFYKTDDGSGWFRGGLRGGAQGDDGAGPSDPQTPTHVSEIPDEALAQIISKLDAADKKALSETSKNLFNAVNQEVKTLTITGSELERALERFPHLTSVKLTGEVTPDQLAALAKAKQLEHLDLAGCANLTDEGLEKLKGLTTLTSLNISRCDEITNAGLAHLSGLTNLSSLKAKWCYQLSDVALSHLGSIKTLESLDLSGWKFTAAGMAPLKNLQNLRHLALDCCNDFTDDGLQNLIGLRNLHSLSLEDCTQLTDDGMRHLPGLQNLHSLNLSGLIHISGEGLACLGKLKQLDAINLGSCAGITDADLAQLSGLKNLRELNLDFCSNVTGAGMTHLRALEKLEVLDLSWCGDITDHSLRQLAALKKLQVLSLAGQDGLTDMGIAHLRGLTDLRLLDLGACPEITDESLAQLADIHGLRTLVLKETAITDAGVAQLSENFKQLSSLDLSRTEVTDAGIGHLVLLENLRYLGLEGCPLTDAGLPSLKALQHLEELDLGVAPPLSAAGINTLRRPGLVLYPEPPA